MCSGVAVTLRGGYTGAWQGPADAAAAAGHTWLVFTATSTHICAAFQILRCYARFVLKSTVILCITNVLLMLTK